MAGKAHRAKIKFRYPTPREKRSRYCVGVLEWRITTDDGEGGECLVVGGNEFLTVQTMVYRRRRLLETKLRKICLRLDADE